MAENVLLLLILWSSMLAYDGRKLKRQGVGAKFAYGVLAAAALYLSVDYLILSLPNLDDVVNFFLKGPAKAIVSATKTKSP